MSDIINTINNNDNTENTLKNLENVFPDPTEDVFWQKVSTIINEIDEDSTNNVSIKIVINSNYQINWSIIKCTKIF
jgi:hypothetical protein